MWLISARITILSLPELRSWITAIVHLVGVPVLTAWLYLAFASGGRIVGAGVADAVAAALAVGSPTATVALPQLIAQDRFQGTLGSWTLATHSRVASWGGRVSVVLVLAALTSAVALTATLPAYAPVAGFGGVMLALVSGLTGSIGVGVMLGALALLVRDALAVANVTAYALPLLAGAVAPLTVLPFPLGIAGASLPIAHAIESGRRFATGQSGATEALWAVLVGVPWLCTGVLLWWLCERAARRRGTIDALALG